MKYTYQAIFEKDGEKIGVVFPDIPGCRTFGADYKDAALMGADVLETMLSAYIDEGIAIPAARYDHRLPEDGTAAFFTIDAPARQAETMTVATAADLLGVSQRRVNAMIADGTLSAVKAGRDNLVTIASVDARLAAPRSAGRPRRGSVLQPQK
jgi:excisionase family DNA binding protein